jgi:UDP:flavonoid glycosyltransferase YjiC (YdhE family)
MAHVILASLGTDGDILPYTGLGATLRGRGHRVTLVAAEDYRALAARHGLEFRSLVTREENAELLGDPDFWHPLKGPRLGARWGVRLLSRQYELFSELARDETSVFVTNPALLAARLVNEKYGRPLATVILQPWMIPSSMAPPVMPMGMSLPRWAPRPIGSLYWRTLDFVGAMLMGRELNELREKIGLAPVSRVFGWWLSPQRVLAMFSPAYAAPQRDWPEQVRLTGFPMFDGSGGGELDPELLAFCRAGEPPVAFTFGTGMVHAKKLFHAGVEACQRLGLRALLLTRHAHQLPAPLPPTVRHVPFAPFRALFPLCGAIVHHGGVGTLARALAAGTPQLILPIAFDQKDNAIHVQKLGAREWIRAGRASPGRIAGALRRLLTPEARARSEAAATQFAETDQLERAARCIEELATMPTEQLRAATPAAQ